MHLKRNEVPRNWPIARKGTKSIVVPGHNKRNGIPVLILLRDILKLAKKRKEVERILREGKVKVNGKLIREDKFTMLLFDIMNVEGKDYKLILENKKFKLQETKDREKTLKITGKKILSGGIVQIQLNDGRNLLVKEKMKMGDSIVLNFDGKITEKIELREGSKIVVISGSHIGEEGKVEKIDEKSKIAIIVIQKEKVNLGLGRIMAI
jgi:small subunit ribosomal protein S4e